jgi:tetratricopeptide (TPR) repeat protein
VIPAAADSPGLHTRLHSLKAIAAHLGRSPRTIQRWISEYGLPVRRLGGDSGPIFVYVDELDNWLRNRGQMVKKGTSNSVDGPVPFHRPPRPIEMIGHRDVVNIHSTSDFRKGRSTELAARGYEMWETLSTADFSTMARLFRDAVESDPCSAKAFAGLALSLVAGGLLNDLNSPIAAASAEDALRRALEIDPESSEAICSRAWIKMASERDWQAASLDFDAVLSRRPQCGPAITGRALLYVAQGRVAEASDLLLAASMQSPLSAPTIVFRCWNEWLNGHSAAALELITEARAIGHSGSALDAMEALALIDYEDPDRAIEPVEAIVARSSGDSSHFHLLQGALGYIYAAAGRTHDAQRMLHNITHPKNTNKANQGYSRALILLALDDRENAAHWLKQSYCDGSLWSLGFRSDPLLVSFRKEPHCRLLFDHLTYPAPEGAASWLAPAS